MSPRAESQLLPPSQLARSGSERTGGWLQGGEQGDRSEPATPAPSDTQPVGPGCSSPRVPFVGIGFSGAMKLRSLRLWV